MVILALDYGDKRIGAAIGNSELKTSIPVKPIKRTDKRSLFLKIKDIINEYDVGYLVVGYPLNMDGSESLMSRRVKNFKRMLRAETGLGVKLIDERLTSFEAEEMLKSIEGDFRRRKELIDSVSAHIILTEYLETL